MLHLQYHSPRQYIKEYHQIHLQYLQQPKPLMDPTNLSFQDCLKEKVLYKELENANAMLSLIELLILDLSLSSSEIYDTLLASIETK